MTEKKMSSTTSAQQKRKPTLLEAVFNYTGFMFALLYGWIGFSVAPQIREDETQPGS